MFTTNGSNRRTDAFEKKLDNCARRIRWSLEGKLSTSFQEHFSVVTTHVMTGGKNRRPWHSPGVAIKCGFVPARSRTGIPATTSILHYDGVKGCLQCRYKVRIVAVKLIWANTNDWAFEGSVEGIIRYPGDVRRTIFLVHSSDFESVLTVQYAIIVKLIPQCRSCEPWAGKLGQWMEIQAINDANHTIGSYET